MPAPLETRIVPLTSLYLDPNNPRFADNLSGSVVKEDKVHEDTVQKKAMGKITEDRFEVYDLKRGIEAIGFIPVDQLVVIELPQPGKYMVVEGNRRLAALKSLMEEEELGEVDLKPNVKESIISIPVLIIKGEDKKAREHFARVLQGVRHVSSVKAWGPYQQAEIVAMMLADGKSIDDIKETLGSSAARINSLRRSYFGLKQMQKDVDYGDKAKPQLFSHFEEAYKSSKFRQWLDWDDNTNEYLNENNRKLFYSWCLPYKEDEVEYPPKVNDAKELRRIGTLMENSALFQQFCEAPTLRLPDAMKGVIEPVSEVPIDWKGELDECIKTSNKIPGADFGLATEADVQRLKTLSTICENFLKQIKYAHELNAQ